MKNNFITYFSVIDEPRIERCKKQHSGAIGYHSDFAALPKFPVSAQYADLDTLKVKLLSLHFSAKFIVETESPIMYSSAHNPPKLILHPRDANMLTTTSCFDSQGKQLPSHVLERKVIIQPLNKLSVGRHRYTCTCKTDVPNRFYWGSHQWLVE